MSFTWRHWADWTGPYRDNPPSGERMQLIGTCLAKVNDQLKIVDLQVYFDPNPMLSRMTACGPVCPFHRNAELGETT